jgi:DNA-binding NarL/FixJ family response regulator
MMAKCVTCGATLHPGRARKYNYCMARECQDRNAQGLTMVAVGMNKAADELLILDEHTRADLASGKYRDQRRDTSAAAAMPRTAAAAAPARRSVRPAPPRAAPDPAPARRPWTSRQERLALLYNEQGLRPAEIAAKLGVSTYTATQIVLAARRRQH